MTDTNISVSVTFKLTAYDFDEESESWSDDPDIIPETVDEKIAQYRNRKEYILKEIEKIKIGLETNRPVIRPPEDTYSFLMIRCDRCSCSVTILVFVCQIAIYLIFVSDRWTSGDIFRKSIKVDSPAVASIDMLILQAIAILLIPIVQKSLITSIIIMKTACSSSTHIIETDKDKYESIRMYWIGGNVLRLLENLASVWMFLVLIERSTSTLTLLKNFTSMLFVTELDEKVFIVANLKFLGESLKQLANEVSEYKIEYHEFESSDILGNFRHKIFSRFFLFLLTIAILYIIWIDFYLIPMFNQSFLCQRIYLQPDDTYNTEHGQIGGYYRSDKIQRNFFSSASYFSPSYVEERFDGDKYIEQDWKPVVLRYCSKQRFWGVSIQHKNFNDECEEENLLLNSMTVQDDQTNDLFTSPKWSGKSEDGREVPVDVLIHCADDDSDDFFSKDICYKIELFDKGNLLKNAPKQYDTLRYDDGKIFEVYNLPVYIDDTVDGALDLVFFTGLRWLGMSVVHLRDFKVTEMADKNKTRNELIEYLSTDYHAMHSNYEIAFFSEPMKTKVVRKNKASPIDLVLFRPMNKQNIRLEDYNRQIPNKFICSICNNETNRCLFEGTCENGVCNCRHGSSGTLCQIKPLGDGFCDQYFNIFRYNFDGGDCCAATCVDSKYRCGMDRTDNLFIGFENCAVDDESRIGPFSQSKAPMNLIGNNIEITTSSDGNILALIELETKRVSIFDSEGNHWIYRDDFVRQFDDTGLGAIIRASSLDNFIRPRDSDVLPPATIAIMGTMRVYIYDWDQSSLNWNEQLIEIGGDNKISKLGTFEICSNGKLLVLLENGQITTFKRDIRHEKFKFISKSRVNNFEFISVSNDPKLFIAANKSCVHVFTNLTLLEDHKECNSGHEIVNIKISPTGKAFGYIVLYQGSADLFVVKRRSGRWERTRQSYSDKYQEIETISDGGNITFSNEWKSVKGYFKKYISYDQRNAVMIIDKSFGMGNPTLLTLKRKEVCEKDEVRIYFTFALDSFPNDLSWEIVQFDTNETKHIMRGDLYDSAIEIRKEFCDSTKSCVGVRIIDFGMDGLTSPGYLGIAFNGSIQWNRTNTIGYSNLFPIWGDDICKEKMREVIPWIKYNITVHNDCLTYPCRWEKIGSSINTFHYAQEENLSIHSSSISADGFIVAVGSFSFNNVSQVNLYVFDAKQNDWLSLGDKIIGKHFNGVDLSADGSNIFISSYINDERGLKNGLINSYTYHEEGSVWSQDCEITIPLTTNNESNPLFYFSTSANGDYIAIAAPFSHGNDMCVYHRDGRKDRYQKVKCFHDDISEIDNSNFFFSDIKISSRGFIVAVSFNKGGVTDDSLIKVFNFNNSWQQQGVDIKAFGGRYDRTLISISSNGLILAIANGSSKKIQIFEYKDNQKIWLPKGNFLEVVNDSGFSLSGSMIVPNLSANGLIVTVSLASQIHVYYYDEQSDVWFNNRQNAPVEYKESEFWLPMTYSADLATVAVGSGTSLSVFRLHRSSCDDTDDIFDLTIEPDDFPNDIFWSLKLDDGEEVSMGFLMDQAQSSYKFCLKKKQFSYVYFSIRDTFRDGLCCTWGEGYFIVKWNGEKVLDETDFTSDTALVLPRDNLEIVEFYIDNISITRLSYVILNNKNVILDDMEISSGQKFQKSLQLPNYDCFTFVIYDVYNSGEANYSFTWKGEDIHNGRKIRFMEMYPMGTCTQTCPEGSDLLEISMVTNIHPTKIIWDVLKFDNQEMLLYDSYTTPNKYSYHSICVPENECYIMSVFQLVDTLGIRQFDNIQNDRVKTDGRTIFYEVVLANYTVFSGPQLTNLSKLEFGKCPELNCSDGFTLLEFDFEVDNHPDEFSWQLKDSAGSILRQGENYTAKLKHYHIYHCIPLRNCTKLVINDTGKNGGTAYNVAWANKRVSDEGDKIYDVKNITFFC